MAVEDRLQRLYRLRERISIEITRLERNEVRAADAALRAQAPADEVRAWAVERGLPVGKKGRISVRLREAFLAERGG